MASIKETIESLRNSTEVKAFLENNYDNRSWSNAFHYTSLYNLYQIFEGHSIKFTQLSQANDVLEWEIARKTEQYFFCLSRGKKKNFDNFGMWAMYGHLKDKIQKESLENYVKQIGVKLSFPKKELINFVKENQLSMRIIGYTPFLDVEDNKISIGSYKTKERIPISQLAGFVKDRSWNYEKELRICIDNKKALESMDDGKVLIPLGDLLNHITVFPSPLYSVEECQKLFNALCKGNDNIPKPNFEENLYYKKFKEK